MRKEHTTFITGLLSNPNLTPFQRDKVVELALRDLNANGSEERILKELDLIKEGLGIKILRPERQAEPLSLEKNGYTNKPVTLEEMEDGNFEDEHEFPNNGVNTSGGNRKIDSPLPKYIGPSDLMRFLSDYNQDPILRYTCHEIDDSETIEEINNWCDTQQYDIIQHQKLILERYEEFVKGYYISKNIKNLILVYLKGENYKGEKSAWSTEKIVYNWSSPELFEWGEKYPGVVPHPGVNLINKIKNKGFKFKKSFSSEISGQRINSFSGLVIHFKHLFHLKGDNPLKLLIKSKNNTENWNGIIDFDIDHIDFWDNLELFTDVDKLLQAYVAIIRTILETVKKYKLEKPQIKLSFLEEEDDIIFSIHHLNTFYQKTIKNTIERLGDSHTRLIKKQINGLCDLYLQADFDHNHFAQINLWNGKERKADFLKEFQGVKYLLKFKK